MSNESGLDDPSELTMVADAEPPKAQLSPTQVGVVQLIDYVRVLIELADKPVWSLSTYGNLVLHEEQLRNRIGIRHDLTDLDRPIYLKVERLRRIDPPEPPATAKDWITIGRDPFKEPVVQNLRTAVITAAEAAKLLADGMVDGADVAPTLKSKLGQNLRDVVPAEQISGSSKGS